MLEEQPHVAGSPGDEDQATLCPTRPPVMQGPRGTKNPSFDPENGAAQSRGPQGQQHPQSSSFAAHRHCQAWENFEEFWGFMAGFCFYRNPHKRARSEPKGCSHGAGGGSQGSQPPEHSQSRIPPAPNSPTVSGSSKS